MNGAENLLQTLEQAGVEVCFANPGTSEMHLVTAIGRSERMRAILCLFEGVVSGAADGYARMADKPALNPAPEPAGPAAVQSVSSKSAPSSSIRLTPIRAMDAAISCRSTDR